MAYVASLLATEPWRSGIPDFLSGFDGYALDMNRHALIFSGVQPG